MFDINAGEALIILVIAVLVVGPARLPKYAEQLGQLVRRARVLLQETKSRVDAELGDDMKDVDWAALDPRQYDPRRIVREALLDDLLPPAAPVRSAGATAESTAAAAAAAQARQARRAAAAQAQADAAAGAGPGAVAGVSAAAGAAAAAGDLAGDRADAELVPAPFDTDAT